LNSERLRKAARFVRFCDAFNIPIVTFVDGSRLSAGHRPGIWRPDQAWRENCCSPIRNARCRW